MLLTVGIPFYNSEKTLMDAIKSVFAQSFQDWELLLIDDGSSDRSFEIANSIKDSRVSVHSDGINRGLIYRLNQIANLARGELLARMDSDDLMHPERLAKQIDYLSANPHTHLVGTASYIIDKQNNVTGIRGDDLLDKRPSLILRKGLMIHPTVMGRTQWFRSNPYDSIYLRAEDKELWIRTCNHSHFGQINEPLFFYREDGVNIVSYLASCKTDRVILKKYGPELIGYIGTNGLIFESFCKSTLYSISKIANFDKFLTGARSKTLDIEGKLQAQSIINSILNP